MRILGIVLVTLGSLMLIGRVAVVMMTSSGHGISKGMGGIAFSIILMVVGLSMMKKGVNA